MLPLLRKDELAALHTRAINRIREALKVATKGAPGREMSLPVGGNDINPVHGNQKTTEGQRDHA